MFERLLLYTTGYICVILLITTVVTTSTLCYDIAMFLEADPTLAGDLENKLCDYYMMIIEKERQERAQFNSVAYQYMVVEQWVQATMHKQPVQDFPKIPYELRQYSDKSQFPEGTDVSFAEWLEVYERERFKDHQELLEHVGRFCEKSQECRKPAWGQGMNNSENINNDK